jgi:hypothetical protein
MEKHPNADNLSIVKVNAFTYCARTEDWLNHPFGVWIEPDYVVPADRPEFAFLADSHKVIENNGVKGYRIKVKRLRGIMSMGLMVPAPEGAKLGDDYREHFGIVRYEPPEPMSTGGEACKPPPGIRYVYDIESAYNFVHLFEIDEEVVGTEKVHGCLHYATRIRMADGTKKEIGKLVNENGIGQEVLGMDENGRVVPTKIVNVFKNGKADKWLKITGNRRCAGVGSSYFAVYATPNHQFYSNGKYIQASELKVGDSVSNLRTDLHMSFIQEQVILGKLLGDASYQKTASRSAAIVFGHKKLHEEYVDWTLTGLGAFANPHKNELISGYGTEMVRGRSISSIFIFDRFDSFINKEGKKIIPAWVADKITPISLAFAYMDDGSLNHDDGQEDRASFTFYNFTKQDCEIFQRGLMKFGIRSEFRNYNDNRNRVILNANDADKFFVLVAPYICSCVQYKLPLRYRGFPAWLPTAENAYKQWIVEQKIDSISEVKLRNHTKFDIETETHNFFANDILVHNSNGRWACVDGVMFCGSRTEWKRQDADNLWWKALANHPEVEAFCKANPDITVYGEAYGQVKHFPYDVQKGKVGIIVFDLLRNGAWVDHDEAREIGNTLPWVPILYRGPWNKETIFSLAEGKSELAKKAKVSHIREGIVVKPIKERNNLEIGRTQLKIVSNAYLEKDYATE